MSATHHTREHRWPVIALVVLVLAGVGIGATVGGTPATSNAPVSPSALVSAPDGESSAWYCTGQTTAAAGDSGSLVFTNTSPRPLTAQILAVSDTGATATATVAVPARSVTTPSLPAVSSGSWEAQTVVVTGGGLAVTQVVSSAQGWSQVPCQSTTSAAWYFPGGSTQGTNGLFVSLYNPTSTPVVVDLAFMTPTGTIHPINYQGIVLNPNQVAVENVASEVQGVSPVSTVVSTRTGRVAATEFQQFGGSSQGLALVAGVGAPQSSWAIPVAQETPGDSSEIDIFNPGTATETVTVRLRVASGPLAPLTSRVAGGTTWALATNSQTRIPANAAYSATVTSGGGPGVVVGRSVVLPASSTAPQAGAALAVDGLSSASSSGQWVVPPPGTSAALPVAGAAPAYLALLNTSGGTETYSAIAATSSGRRTVASGTLAAGAVALVQGAPLAAAGLDQIVVRASGPMAVSEDVGPSGGIGVVSMPGIALAASIGGV